MRRQSRLHECREPSAACCMLLVAVYAPYLDVHSCSNVSHPYMYSQTATLMAMAWTCLTLPFFIDAVMWLYRRYGEPRYPLPRKVIARGLMQEPVLELRPPSFKVHLLTPTSIPGQSSPVREVTVSSTDKIRAVRHAFATAVSPQKAALGQFRVWKTTSNASMDQLLFPADTLRTCGASLLEDDENTVGDELVDTSEVFVVELMTREKWILDASEVAPPPNGAPSPSAPPPPPPPTQPGPLFGSGTDFFTQLQKKAPPVTNATTSAIKPGPANALTKSSTRPKVQHDPGTLGLGNMYVVSSREIDSALTSI